MKALLFEQWNGGHYTNYLESLIPEMASLGVHVVVAVNDVMKRALEQGGAWRSSDKVSFAPPLPPVGTSLTLRDRYAATRNLLSSLQVVKPDFTILPSADAQTAGLAALHALGGASVRRAGPIEGTLHYGYGHSTDRLKEHAKEIFYAETYRRVPFVSVNFVSFAYYEYAVAKRLIRPERMRLVGDPVPQPVRIGRDAARRLFGLDPAGRYLGMFGGLDRRKALPELLLAFRAAALGNDVRLILGGRLDPSYATLIQDAYSDLVRAGRIVVIDRFLSNAEVECAYEALDLATIVYYRFPGLASLALKAVAAGTPMIVHDFGWLRALVRRFDVGITTNIFDPAVFASDLRRGLATARNDHSDEAIRRLLRFHERENFVSRMTSGLQLASGATPRPSVDWDWVLAAVSPERRALW